MNADNEIQAASDSAATITPASPGAMIRQGRERMNLSLDELAGVTKLSYHTIESLERDDFSSLLEAVYVRGYYRKCAKVLDLSEKNLLEAYEARVAPKQVLPPAKLRLASGADLGSSSRLPVTLGIAAAIVAVLVCTVLWFARSGGEQPSAPQAVESTPAVSVEEQGTPVPAGDLAVPAPAAAGPTAVPPTAATTDPVSADATVPAAAVAPAAPAAAAPVAATPATPATATAAPATSSAVLSFTATSWVRVDDASGKTLFNGLAQPGESHQLSGALPFNVFLGNAPAVKVEFAGRPFDTQSFTRDNKTARFTLPAR